MILSADDAKIGKMYTYEQYSRGELTAVMSMGTKL